MSDTKSGFFDEARIYVRGGRGGNGCTSFRREKFIPLGGPDGGNGGRGGSVYLEASRHLNTLIGFQRQRHFRAEDGAPGQGKNMQGKSGEDLVISVPAGTVVQEAKSTEVLADFTAPGQRVVVAQGGRGGRGNSAFTTSTNRAPRLSEKGEPGEERWLELELRLIAEVGIVGCPNAGKSTLLAAVSAARPKIADYPFTTLTPNLGVVAIDERSFVLADLPGLIEGAYQGLGLGHEFLRHVARTHLLLHLLDGASQDPLADWSKINRELELFDPKVAAKPQLVVLNKMDLPQTQEKWPQLRQEMERKNQPVMAISAATGQGLKELLHRVVQMLDSLPPEAPQEEVAIFRLPPDEEDFRIYRVGEGYRVRGERIERSAAMTNWDQEEATRRFQQLLERLGISQALREAGIQPGDTVYIGEVELEWE